MALVLWQVMKLCLFFLFWYEIIKDSSYKKTVKLCFKGFLIIVVTLTVQNSNHLMQNLKILNMYDFSI